MKNDEGAKELAQLRIKVIVFRDYSCDEEPMSESQFYLLPDQNEEFVKYINSIKAKGGKEEISEKNEPANSLEALALALKSDWASQYYPWQKTGYKVRHIIMLFTDSPAIPLRNESKGRSYPDGMPMSLCQLNSWRNDTDETIDIKFRFFRGGGIIGVVPEAEPWVDLQDWARYYPLFPDLVEKYINNGDYENAVQFAWDMAARSI